MITNTKISEGFFEGVEAKPTIPKYTIPVITPYNRSGDTDNFYSYFFKSSNINSLTIDSEDNLYGVVYGLNLKSKTPTPEHKISVLNLDPKNTQKKGTMIDTDVKWAQNPTNMYNNNFYIDKSTNKAYLTVNNDDNNISGLIQYKVNNKNLTKIGRILKDKPNSVNVQQPQKGGDKKNEDVLVLANEKKIKMGKLTSLNNVELPTVELPTVNQNIKKSYTDKNGNYYVLQEKGRADDGGTTIDVFDNKKKLLHTYGPYNIEQNLTNEQKKNMTAIKWYPVQIKDFDISEKGLIYILLDKDTMVYVPKSNKPSPLASTQYEISNVYGGVVRIVINYTIEYDPPKNPVAIYRVDLVDQLTKNYIRDPVNIRVDSKLNIYFTMFQNSNITSDCGTSLYKIIKTG